MTFAGAGFGAEYFHFASVFYFLRSKNYSRCISLITFPFSQLLAPILSLHVPSAPIHPSLRSLPSFPSITSHPLSPNTFLIAAHPPPFPPIKSTTMPPTPPSARTIPKQSLILNSTWHTRPRQNRDRASPKGASKRFEHRNLIHKDAIIALQGGPWNQATAHSPDSYCTYALDPYFL